MTKIKILIVGDSKKNAEAIAKIIKNEQVEIFATTSEEEALDLIANNEFGLALLDVEMPKITGFELAKIIRSVNHFKALPIIFITSQPNDSRLIFEGYQTGAVDLLFKPLDVNMVRAKVQIFVEMAKQRELLQRHVRELQQLRIEADVASLAKSQFLANMSHEIRTPLAAVMGFAELATRNEVSSADKNEFASAVKRNGLLLMRLIDDILDLSKIEANKLEFEHTDFDLNEVLLDVDSNMAYRARENNVTMTFNLPKTVECKYVSDPVRIKQILLNIIGNAIKFSQGGKVDVDVNLQPQKNDLDRLIIRVKDTGVGLTPEQAVRLFQPFAQADSSTTRQYGGSGLGLVISKQIACALGGDIKLVSSKPGKGSLFEIQMTLKRDALLINSKTKSQTAKDNQNTKSRSLEGYKILAVDDSPDNLALLKHYLKESGIELSLVDNGATALDEVAKKNFDLVLMDVQMPLMDGHETTAKMRKLNFNKPIIALTAHALQSEHEKCRQAGCDSVLTKPISKVKLIEQLNNYLH